MTRPELADALAQRVEHLTPRDVDLATRLIIAHIADSLARGERVEIRGFGVFSTRYHPAHMGRNPATGAPVRIKATCTPHFRAGAAMRIAVMKYCQRKRTVENA